MRIIVAGGRGFFGRTITELLRDDGLRPLVASRGPGADVECNVEDARSLRAALRSGDVVIDTVGPFQDRSTTLVEAACEVGFDVVDLSDSIAYARKVWDLKPRIDAAGVRVLTACSAMSAISAALVRQSGFAEPVRVTGFIAPASRHSANSATGASLLRSVGQPIEVLRDGELVTQVGWLDRRTIEVSPPLGQIRGHMFETVDSFLLPKVWPTIRTAEFFVDSRVPGLNGMFTLAAHAAPLRRLMERFQSFGLVVARRFGASTGGLAYEIECSSGAVRRFVLATSDRAYRIAAVPAVLAAHNIAMGRFPRRGMVSCDHLVAADELFRYLSDRAVDLGTLEGRRCNSS
jgi:hypothetical protein